MRNLIIPLIAVVEAANLCIAPAQADLGDQLAKLLPIDGEAGDAFGWSVSVDNDFAAVGAIGTDDNGTGYGSAYLFNTATGEQIAKLLPNDPAASYAFGYSIAIDNGIVAVGTPSYINNGIESGCAYLFNASNGDQITKLLPIDGGIGDAFGYSIAIDNGIVAVGAPDHEHTKLGPNSAYLFDASTGVQVAELIPKDGKWYDTFGRSIDINNGVVVVGSPGNASAYLFNASTGTQHAKLVPDDGWLGDYFGESVAISGNTVIVGANYDDDNGANSGSAYLFDISDPKNPIQSAKLLPDDGAEGDHFGFSVEISGETAIVGAWGDSEAGYHSGSAYFFDTTTGQQIYKVFPFDGSGGDNFGFSVAISGSIAIVGAIGDNDNGSSSGSAYLFDASDCPWDLDKTGSVGTGDLLNLFAQWGTAGTADFDDSGTVDTNDLLILFANWGPCK